MPEASQTDKIDQGYVDTYLSLKLGDEPIVVEIGTAHGAGLKLFREIYEPRVLLGVDQREPLELLLAGRKYGAGILTMDQNDPELPQALLTAVNLNLVGGEPARVPFPGREVFNLVVDDASHDGPRTARTFELLWPMVVRGGYYVIEDWFVGFPTHPDYDDSMVRLAQDLLLRLSDRAGDVATITYQYGLIVLRKSTERPC